jgi:hypothetical protein
MRSYYEQRTIYGEKIIYYSARQVYDDWHGGGDIKHTFETMIPDSLQPGQPMMIRVQLNRADKPDVVDAEMGMIGTVTRIGAHDVEVTIPASERAKIEALVAKGKAEKPRRVRPPVHVVDADRLMAWQLYWRGENFWSGGEIWAFLPEMRTAFVPANNAELNKYFSDRTRAIPGRRYFVITEGARITGFTSIAPTTRARDTYQVLDTSSNKFAIAAFWL